MSMSFLMILAISAVAASGDFSLVSTKSLCRFSDISQKYRLVSSCFECDLWRQSRAISTTWFVTKRTMGWESRFRFALVEFLYSLMKLVRRSSICAWAFGNLSLKRWFIVAMLLSPIGERLGELKLLERGRNTIGLCRSAPMLPSLLVLLVSLKLSGGVDEEG